MLHHFFSIMKLNHRELNIATMKRGHQSTKQRLNETNRISIKKCVLYQILQYSTFYGLFCYVACSFHVVCTLQYHQSASASITVFLYFPGSLCMPWVVILNWIMGEARETRPIAVLKTLALCDEQRQNKSLQPSFKKHHPILLQLHWNLHSFWYFIDYFIISIG